MNRFYRIVIITLLILSVLCLTVSILFVNGHHPLGIRLPYSFTFAHLLAGIIFSVSYLLSSIVNLVNYAGKSRSLRIITIVFNCAVLLFFTFHVLDAEELTGILLIVPFVFPLIGSIGKSWKNLPAHGINVTQK